MIKVQVTKQDIDSGVFRDCHLCPVAIALARATGDDHAAVINHDYMIWLKAWSGYTLAPQSVQDFVWGFDTGKSDIGPFEFEIPPINDNKSWKYSCGGCESLFFDGELDNALTSKGCLQ